MKESEIIRPIMDLLDILQKQGRLYYVRCVSAPALGREGRPRKGQPDFVGWAIRDAGWGTERIWPFAWEVKGPRGTVSDGQAAELQRVSELGGQAKVIRSFEEAVAALTELGIEVERSE